jgi:hypothetical protein
VCTLCFHLGVPPPQAVALRPQPPSLQPAVSSTLVPLVTSLHVFQYHLIPLLGLVSQGLGPLPCEPWSPLPSSPLLTHLLYSHSTPSLLSLCPPLVLDLPLASLASAPQVLDLPLAGLLSLCPQVLDLPLASSAVLDRPLASLALDPPPLVLSRGTRPTPSLLSCCCCPSGTRPPSLL